MAQGKARPGSFFSISGTELFAQQGFLPLISYLKQTLLIGDADVRLAMNGTHGGKGAVHLNIGLVTESHLCCGVLKAILPFFDTIVILESATAEGYGDLFNRSNSSYSSTSMMAERQDRTLRNYVKGFKLRAMLAAPYALSMFLDHDMIPCSKNFMKDVIESMAMPFDIAMSEILPSNIPTNDSRHYVGSAQSQQRECPPDLCKFNHHNSACVVLNMTSQRTQTLLRKSIEFFFSRNYENSTIDQPAIGRAMYEVWQQHGLIHVDLNQELVCRPKTHPAGKAGVVCSPDTTCAIAHKWDFARAKDAARPVLGDSKTKSKTVHNSPAAASQQWQDFPALVTGNNLSKTWNSVSNKFKWCTYEDEANSTNSNRPTGLIYNKMPKAASTSTASVVLRIAHSVARKKFGLREETPLSNATILPCSVKYHHNTNYSVGVRYGNRDKARSFLFTTVRDPAERALSRLWFSHVSQKKETPSDENILTWLRESHSQKGAVSPGTGGFQLAYASLKTLEKSFAWRKEEPNKVQNPDKIHDTVRNVMNEYDFVMPVERFDESLVVLQYLMGLDVTDLLHMSSRVSNKSFFYSKPIKACVPLLPVSKSTTIQKYLKSEAWESQNYGDYLLYEAASQSLDLTIAEIGNKTFHDMLQEYRYLQQKAEKYCKPFSIFPCDGFGNAQISEAKNNCFDGDKGCGNKCLDEFSERYYYEKMKEGERAVKPTRRQRLVLFLHPHKAGGTSIIRYMREIPLKDLSAIAFNESGNVPIASSHFPWNSSLAGLKKCGAHGDRICFNSSDVQSSAILGNPEFWKTLYELGVEMVPFEENFLTPSAFISAHPSDSTNKSFDAIGVFREPFERFRSNYERELQLCCKKISAYNATCFLNNELETWMKGGWPCQKERENQFGAMLGPNFYTRIINGLNDQDHNKKLSLLHLEQAKRIVSQFEVLLVLEDLHEEREQHLRQFFNLTKASILGSVSNNGLKAHMLYSQIHNKSLQHRRKFDNKNLLDLELYYYIRYMSALQRRNKGAFREKLIFSNESQPRLVFFKIPKTAGRSLKMDINFASQKESCFRVLQEENKEIPIVTMMRSPRAHVISQYMHCRFRPGKWPALPAMDNGCHNKSSFPQKSELLKGFNVWLDHMLDANMTFSRLEDSFHCYTPWNLQSRMLTCSVNASGHNGAQIIHEEYEKFTEKPTKIPHWRKVEESILSKALVFIGLTERYSESVCAIKWIQTGSLPASCSCDAPSSERQPQHQEDHGVPHLLDASDLSMETLRKIDSLTRIDRIAYELARHRFVESISSIEQESGAKIICD